MFVGWLMNIRCHGRHIGQPAYGHLLMCRPNEHKQVYYLDPPFLSLASLSLIASPRTTAAAKSPHAAAPATPCSEPHRPTPAGTALVAPCPTSASAAPVAHVGPRPCPAAPDPPRPGWSLSAGRAPLLGLITTNALCAR
jgi:diadenosine tetraphosphatase ApaH/serine/threonine PP2A family protein phosphatase